MKTREERMQGWKNLKANYGRKGWKAMKKNIKRTARDNRRAAAR